MSENNNGALLSYEVPPVKVLDNYWLDERSSLFLCDNFC